MDKNRAATEKALLDAVGREVRKGGFASLGVNLVAESAGVSKVLIYRYFGGLEGLIREWVLINNYWAKDISRLESAAVNYQGNVKKHLTGMIQELFSGQADELNSSIEKREMIRWLIAEKNETTAAAMKKIEDNGVKISRYFKDQLEGSEDIDAMVSILIGGLYYLSVISDRTSVFNSIPLNTEKGQERIKNSVNRIIETMLKNFNVKKTENKKKENKNNGKRRI